MSLSSRSSSSGHSSGGGNGPAPPVAYYAYRHPASGDHGGMEPINFMSSSAQPRGFNFGDRDSNSSRKKGSVSMQNGALNFHIPCAFSYAYDVPVPPQSESQTRSSKASSLRGRGRGKDKKNVQRNAQQPSKSSCVPQPTCPFVTTVKSGELFNAQKMPQCRETSRTQAITRSVMDFDAGKEVPFKVVDYGQELYEQAAQNIARQLQEQKIATKKSSEMEDNCYDFSKPAINSSRRTTKVLEKAREDLKNLPNEVEKLLRNDKRFEPIITSKATRSLKVPRSSSVYKDLIPVDPNPDVRTEAENMIQAEIWRSMEAVRQPSRAKDPEPKLEDFQSNSYTRIRPAAVPTPPKPTSGISIEASHDFDTIQAEKRLEHESNRSE